MKKFTIIMIIMSVFLVIGCAANPKVKDIESWIGSNTAKVLYEGFNTGQMYSTSANEYKLCKFVSSAFVARFYMLNAKAGYVYPTRSMVLLAIKPNIPYSKHLAAQIYLDGYRVIASKKINQQRLEILVYNETTKTLLYSTDVPNAVCMLFMRHSR